MTSGSTRVIGSGTNGDRFRNFNTDNNLGDTSNAGNVTIRYAGPITSFSFTYRNQVNTGRLSGSTWATSRSPADQRPRL